MTANRSVPRGERLMCAPGAAVAAKKILWRAMKSRQVSSMPGSSFAMIPEFYRESASASHPHFRRGRESDAKAQKSSTSAGSRIRPSATGRRQMKFF